MCKIDQFIHVVNCQKFSQDPPFQIFLIHPVKPKWRGGGPHLSLLRRQLQLNNNKSQGPLFILTLLDLIGPLKNLSGDTAVLIQSKQCHVYAQPIFLHEYKIMCFYIHVQTNVSGWEVMEACTIWRLFKIFD